jgi:hypothetical protein
MAFGLSLSLGLSQAFIAAASGSEAWILALGAWNDTGVWDDSNVWKDS